MQQVYHLIGIGGIGMSALARILLQRGCRVQGSDQKASPLLDVLRSEGIEAHVGHDPKLLQAGMMVVYSSDIKPDHVEMLRAKELGLALWHRSELLDLCIREKRALLVTGTHGKTTTSSLLAHVLVEAGLNPSFAVGGIPHNLQVNGRSGEGEYFVAEADESDGSFLKTRSFGAIVTNLENDHLSYWQTSEALDAAFFQFFNQCDRPDLLFWCADDPRLQKLYPSGQSYGFREDAAWQVSNFQQEEEGIAFDLSHREQTYSSIKLSLLGRHNALNGAAVFALAISLQIPEEAARRALASFSGVKRRLEKKGEVESVQFFDDYGHHPTEIQTTLEALRRKIGQKRFVVVFQPHRYTRVQELLDAFCHVFTVADLVILTEIYGAGEPPVEGLFSTLRQALQQKLDGKLCFLPAAELAAGAAKLLAPNDVVLTIGAGDISQKGEQIQECLRNGQ